MTNNTAQSTAEFLYNHIITRYGCPRELMSDQGTHFINDAIWLLIEEFMITHKTSTAYYPQDNRQVESTNKTLVNILTKIVVENQRN